ncbi:MAG TPA: FAD-dependent monooxygenase [Mycobacteriales bacterium]|nr:FAD-dependent monooxygenase [Mycobacteriales bacterium]
MPVVVVGAGPTGLTAALDLAYRGVPSVVLDAGRPRPDGSRAIAIHSSALAVWERLGCAEEMLAEGVAWRVRRTYHRDRELYAQVMPEPAPGVLPTFLNLPQHRTEQFLIRRAEAAPLIDLRWEHRVAGVDRESGVVDVDTARGPVRFHASHVLACDGARSAVRRLLGLAFPGTTYADRFLVADVRAELPFPPEPRFFFDHPTNPGSTVLVHPQPDGVWRIDWQLGSSVDIEAERSPAALARRIRGVLGDAPYELVWLSDYRFHQRLLPELRHGRVFFLGDAAHLVAPFGARGMNSAIHDVENLGWKLAAVLRDEAPATLLDTYQAERHPAQRHDQRVTEATMRFMAPRTPAQRLRRGVTLWLAGRYAPASRWVDSGRMSTPYTYADSPIVCADGECWPGAPVPGAKVPTASPELRRLVGQGFVALYFGADGTDGAPVVTGAQVVTADARGPLGRAYGAVPGSVFLVRPDGHLAARRRSASAEDREDLEGELEGLVRYASGAGRHRGQVAEGLHSSCARTPLSRVPTSLATLTSRNP